MRTKINDQKGMALVTVIVLMLLLSLIATSALFSSNTGKKISANYRYATDALQNADAGISDAARQLVNGTIQGDVNNCNWVKSNCSTPGFNNKYRVSYVLREDNGGNKVIAKDSSGRPYYQIESTGFSSGAAGVQRKILAMIKMIGPGGGGGSPFDNGVFGDKGVTLGGNGSVDSYNSTKGAYGINGNKGSNGNIATNATGKDVIDLKGANAKVFGNASVGPGGDPSEGINDPKGGIQGTTGAITEIMDMTPKNAPTGGIPLPPLSGANLALNGGTYRVDSINLASTNVVAINGDVTLIVNGEFKMAGQSQILISNGASLTLYVGTSIDITGQGIINQSQSPGKLLIYGSDKCDKVKLAGDADLYAAIYAPKAAATTGTGNGSIFGSVVAMTIKTGGNGSIHYDESLKNPVGGGDGPPGPATGYKMLSWKEL